MDEELILNDQSFMFIPSTPPILEEANSLTVPEETMTTDQHEDIENLQLVSETSETINKTEAEVSEIKDISNSSEENHVESPTTGEGFVFKCVFCEQILTANEEPKLLECLHNACSGCISSKMYDHGDGINKGPFECPLCSMPCDTTKIIENQFLLETGGTEEQTASKAADLKCSSCSDDAVATSYCTDCADFICDNCVQAHQRLKITKDHTIKPKEDGLSEMNTASSSASTNLFCLNHPHEKLSLFCETCDKLTCRDCQLTEHREHKYKFTNEIASEARKYIAEMLKDVGYKRVLLKSAMKVIEDRQNLITDKKQALVKEITQLVVKLTNTINVRGKQLVSKLTEVCDSKQKTLQEKKEALEQLSKMTDHCIDFTQHALDNGSDMALLYSKKHMTEHLKRIKCKRADIPNPEIPVRIHLAVDKVPDLIKVMSTIGQIVVDGRVYPSQSSSPSQIPPQGSPSPGQSHPPQQQSPINPSIPPTNFQQPRLPNPPPYVNQQFSNSNVQQFPNCPPRYNQNMNSVPSGYDVRPPNITMNQSYGNNTAPQNSMGSRMPIRHPAISQNMPLTLTQQLNMSWKPNMQPRPYNSQIGHQQQQQVSSSTHPNAMMQDHGNLRHLLQPSCSGPTLTPNNPVYVQTGPAQYQAVQPHLAQQFQKRFPGHQQPQPRYRPNQYRMMMNSQQNMPSRMSMQRQQFPIQGSQNSQAKWHIPQQNNPYNQGQNRNTSLPTINDNFKITLKPQTDSRNLPATVTSTIPKTPSPNHVQGKSDTERNLDKYCEDSVKDLMATIAKLDSNGVQVLAEGRQKGGSPQVDSSTGDAGPSGKVKNEVGDLGKDDPNEDWCAVCMDGGELVCCDKCPKVFHQFCHIPNLSVEENDTWQCLLCMNFADIPDSMMSEKKDGELSLREKKIAERLVLELYCQYDISLPFREILGPENIDYHSVIKNPIALDTIRQKLNWTLDGHYTSLEQLVRDVRLMFKNAYTFNGAESQVYNDAKMLEKFFDEQLEKFLPEYAYEMFDDDDDDIHPPSRKYRRVITD